MTKKGRRHEGRGALDLIDEAVHLLRLAPLGTLASYCVGSLPFVLGLLYFWADMSRSAVAEERCAPAALGVGLLFLWMKCWQVRFARQLRAQVAGASVPSGNFRAVIPVAIQQMIFQPSALFIVPLALLITLPFGWVFAFYQNLTALSGEVPGDPKELFRKALRQAELWPAQNHLVLLVLSAFGIFVFLNVALGAVAIPRLLHMLFGVELAFVTSWASVFNTTFLAVVSGVTFLCLDPLVKAVYLLRCFYGESLRSGEDLKAELKSCLPKSTMAAASLIALLSCAGTTFSSAAIATQHSFSINSILLPFHEPNPLIPSFSPSGGEGARRADEGDFQRLMAPIRVQSLEVFPTHEPGWGRLVPKASAVLRGRAVLAPIAFMVPMRVRKVVEAFHEPALCSRRGDEAEIVPKADSTSSGQQLRFMIPMQAPSETRLSRGDDTRNSVSSAELDRSINQVIQQREYSWRQPRENRLAGDDRPKGLLKSFADGMVATVKSWAKTVGQYLGDLVEWLARKLGRWLGGGQGVERSGAGWQGASRWLLFALLAIAACVLAIVLLRTWRRRRRTPDDQAVQSAVALPDLADENIVADQLPEDDWLKLARALAEQGDLRSALRALFLASLAHLARREMIALARFKSNREYERELLRRARAWPEVPTAFARNVTIYDRVWYGRHEASQELLDQFTSNWERIKAC